MRVLGARSPRRALVHALRARTRTRSHHGVYGLSSVPSTVPQRTYNSSRRRRPPSIPALPPCRSPTSTRRPLRKTMTNLAQRAVLVRASRAQRDLRPVSAVCPTFRRYHGIQAAPNRSSIGIGGDLRGVGAGQAARTRWISPRDDPSTLDSNSSLHHRPTPTRKTEHQKTRQETTYYQTTLQPWHNATAPYASA